MVHYRDGVVTSYHRLETDWSTSFRDATFDFIDAILDHRPPRLDAAEGRATLAFALAAQLSATEHREVAVTEVAGEGAGAAGAAGAGVGQAKARARPGRPAWTAEAPVDRLARLAHGPDRRPGEARPRLVLDTDTFNEVDDQFALVHVLLSPDRVDLEAVYAAPFHNEKSLARPTGCAKATRRSTGSSP